MVAQIANTILRSILRYPWMLAVLLLTGCFGDGKQSTIRPESDSARIIQDVYIMVTWIDVGIFIVVATLLAVAMIKYRAGAQKDIDIPKQVHGNVVVELIWTLVPAILLIFIAVPTWQGIFRAAAPPRAGALHVEAIGHQWWWEFRYPSENIVTANELHIPVNRTVVVKTWSADVIHSIWMPRLAGKIDSLPGKSNEIWFTPEKIGEYLGQCAEFCGTSHANMRFKVIVDSPSDYQTWVDRQSMAPVASSPEAQAGEKLFAAKACGACHTISGVAGAVGVIGPNLNDLGSRTTIASGILENTPENLAAWIQDPQAMKPGALMILPFEVNASEAAQLAAFLTSEPGAAAPAPAVPAPAVPAPPTAGSDVSAQDIIGAKGCTICHAIPGFPAPPADIGPPLAGLMSRDTFAGGAIQNTEDNLRAWLKNPPGMKPGTLMLNVGLTDPEIDALIDFLKTLE